jgi:hypothetical protein
MESRGFLWAWRFVRMNKNKTRLIFLVEHLAGLAKRDHTYCEDSWYSCPKAEGGCANDNYAGIKVLLQNIINEVINTNE